MLASGLVAALGAATLAQYLFGVDLGVDQLLIADRTTAPPLPAGRMAPVTAFNFVCLGLALLLAFRDSDDLGFTAEIPALLAIGTAFVAILGYLYNVKALYTIESYVSIALHTAIAFVILGAGVLLARPSRGLMRLITGDGAGGLMARRLLPLAMLLPVALGFLRIQAHALLGIEIGVAALTAANVALFVAIVAWMARSLDLVERTRRQLDVVSRSEEKFRSLLEAAPDAIVIADAAGKIVLVNDAVARVFGYAREEIVGRPVEILVPARFRDAYLRHRGRYVAAPEARAIGSGLNLYGLRKDGTEVPVEISLSPMRTADGLLITAAIRDVSERRALEEARARLAALVDASDEAIVGTTPDGIVTSWNSGAERMSGYTAAEAIGKPLSFVIPDDRIAERAEMQRRCLAGEHGRFESLRRLKDGSLLDVLVTISPIRDPSGAIVGVSSIARDLTERKRMETRLVEAKAAADALRKQAEEAKLLADVASRAKSDFLARMSHELRTPLNAIMGFAQMLQIDRTNTLTEKQKEYSGHILSSGQHLLELINEVLDIAAVEAGRLRFSPEVVVVADTLKDVETMMLPLASKARVTLEISGAIDSPLVRTDRLRLRQILVNLVSNAIKYNRIGGSVNVTTMTLAEGRLRFVVADTGIGIAPERHAEVFQPFSRVNADTSAIEGTGIGLALSKLLIEAMGGSVGFTSAAGQGSTFWADVPIEAAAAAPAPATPNAAALHAVGREFSLLYVEDNPANVRLMEHLLSTKPGAAMLVASSGTLGLDLAVAHRPDVIVLDIDLPGMSGLEVLGRLRSMPETADIPVLALTAAATPGDLARGQAAGFFRYLTKPIDVKVFFAAVDAALANSPRTRPARAASCG